MDREKAVTAIFKIASWFAITILLAFVFVDSLKDKIPF